MSEAPDPVVPSSGWGVLHLFYRVDPIAAAQPGAAKVVLDAIAEYESHEHHQTRVFTVLGHKAELCVMAVGPDLALLQVLQHALTGAGLVPSWSYLSLTETSEYGATEADERLRLQEEDGVNDPAEVETRLAAWRDRIEHYREQRIHPRLPTTRTLCFYPMSKRRSGDDNWYALDGGVRKRLMAGHARVGRRYAGRVVQLITGSTGIDDWEWGVTLFADDPASLKEIVYEMRFDEVSARYAEFGPFVTGLVLEPEVALARVGFARRDSSALG